MNYEQVIIDLLSAEGIEYWTEGKNVSDDSINVNCPFCLTERGDVDPSNHCGIFIDTMIFHCWRCSKRGSFAFLLAVLTNRSIERCEQMIEGMGVTLDDDVVSQVRSVFAEGKKATKAEKNVFRGLPEQFEELYEEIDFPLLDKYLEHRDLYLDTLMDHGCGVCRTGPYMNRLIIPVIMDGKIVAFQAADMTGRAMLKYKNSSNDMDYLYNYDNIKEDDIVVLVEGVLDAWRVGKPGVCTFGSTLTPKQRGLIINLKPAQLVFCWDNDAYWAAKKESEYFMPFVDEIYVVRLPEWVEKNGIEKKADPDELGYAETWRHIEQEIGEEWMIK